MFAEISLSEVWVRSCAGLGGLAVTTPGASAMVGARVRVGVAPLRALLELLGCLAARSVGHAIDGSILCCPDTTANLTELWKAGL